MLRRPEICRQEVRQIHKMAAGAQLCGDWSVPQTNHKHIVRPSGRIEASQASWTAHGTG